MGMMINRRRVMGGESLPYDAEIEYLEGTGTQYIDTSLTYFADFEVTCKLRSNNKNKTLGVDSIYCLQRINASAPFWQFLSGSNNRYNTTIPITELHTLKWLDNKIYCDNVFLTNLSKNNISGKMILFGAGISIYPCIIYSCKLYHPISHILIMDYIPVRIGQIGYMYDKVSGQLFGNSGTGNFILGPDK